MHNTRKNGRVVDVDLRIVFGKEDEVKAALEVSPVSNTINTTFIERQNGTGRNRNARKTYCFSKDWDVHNAVTYFTMYSYNFCWPVRTLRECDSKGLYHPRTPAMAAGLFDYVWSRADWLTFPAIQLR